MNEYFDEKMCDTTVFDSFQYELDVKTILEKIDSFKKENIITVITKIFRFSFDKFNYISIYDWCFKNCLMKDYITISDEQVVKKYSFKNIVPIYYDNYGLTLIDLTLYHCYMIIGKLPDNTIILFRIKKYSTDSFINSIEIYLSNDINYLIKNKMSSNEIFHLITNEKLCNETFELDYDVWTQEYFYGSYENYDN